MRSIIIIALFALGILGSACGSSESGSSSAKEEVVASFYPLAFAAKAVGGPRVQVVNLTPAGAEPHDLEVTPHDLADVRSADLVLLLGHDFQPQLEDTAGNSDKVLKLLDTPGLDTFQNGDPHVWLDPIRYSLIVERIGDALRAKTGAKRLASRLRALDRRYQSALARCARVEIVTSHEAFAYLAQRYGLKQVAITGLTPEAEPAPRDLARVIDVVRKTHATTIFFETLVSPRIAQTVARETGAKTAVLNPIEGLTPDEEQRGEDYFSLMRMNLAHLRAALGCR